MIARPLSIVAAVIFLSCLAGCPDEPCTPQNPTFVYGTTAGSLDMTPTSGPAFHADTSDTNEGATIDGTPDKAELLVSWLIGNNSFQLRFQLGDLRSLQVGAVVKVDTEIAYESGSTTCVGTEPASAILTVTKFQGSAAGAPNYVSGDFAFEGTLTFETTQAAALQVSQPANSSGDCSVTGFTDIKFSTSISQTAINYGTRPSCVEI